MELTEEIKSKIHSEFSEWSEIQYAGKDKKEKQKMGQFFTPPELSIKMLEKFEDLNGRILDPTVGCGGLLAAAVIAGADPRKCYGIELDPEIAVLCRERLSKLGVPRFNIKIGDTLKDESYDFNEENETKSFLYFKIEDLGLSKIKIYLEQNSNGRTSFKDVILDYIQDSTNLRNSIEKLYNVFKNVTEKELYICSEKLSGRLQFMNKLFKKYINETIDFNKEKIIEVI